MVGNIQLRQRPSFHRPANIESDAVMKKLGKYYSAKIAASNAQTNVSFRNYITIVKKELLKVVLEFKSKKIDNDKFATLIRGIIKDAHKESFELGLKAAGIEDLDSREKRWVRDSINNELKYVNNLIQDTINNRGVDPIIRVQRFIPAMQSSYASGRQQGMPNQNIIIYWRLEGTKPDGKNCDTCLELNKMNPFSAATLPFVPRSGNTACYHNCRCNLIYKFEADKSELTKISMRLGNAKKVVAKLKKKGLLPK